MAVLEELGGPEIGSIAVALGEMRAPFNRSTFSLHEMTIFQIV